MGSIESVITLTPEIDTPTEIEGVSCFQLREKEQSQKSKKADSENGSFVSDQSYDLSEWEDNFSNQIPLSLQKNNSY